MNLILSFLILLVVAHWFFLGPAWNNWCKHAGWSRAANALGHLTYTQLLMFVGAALYRDWGHVPVNLGIYLFAAAAFVLWGWTVKNCSVSKLLEFAGMIVIWLGYLAAVVYT